MGNDAGEWHGGANSSFAMRKTRDTDGVARTGTIAVPWVLELENVTTERKGDAGDRMLVRNPTCGNRVSVEDSEPPCDAQDRNQAN